MNLEYKKSQFLLCRLKKKNLFFVFDFDGTLAPIVSDPNKAYMRPVTKRLLEKLSKQTQIGIISGRSLSDLKKRITFKLDLISGTHGLESPFSTVKDYKEFEIFFKGLQETLKEMFPEFTYEKKTIGFTIHYRNLQDSQELVDSVLELLKTFPELKIIKGKKVLNILPNRPHNKGWVMQKLLEKNPETYFFYIGDDTTDEDIFCIHNERLVSIRIGKSIKSSAILYINNQKGIDNFLSDILFFKEGII